MTTLVLFFDYDSYKDDAERDADLEKVQNKCTEDRANCMVYIWVKERPSFVSDSLKKRDDVLFCTDVDLLRGNFLFTKSYYFNLEHLRRINNVDEIEKGTASVVPLPVPYCESSTANDAIPFAQEIETSSVNTQTPEDQEEESNNVKEIEKKLKKVRKDLDDLLNKPEDTIVYSTKVESLMTIQDELIQKLEDSFGSKNTIMDKLPIDFLEQYLVKHCVKHIGEGKKETNYIIKNDTKCQEYYRVLKKKISTNYQNIDNLQKKISELYDEVADRAEGEEPPKKSKEYLVIHNVYKEVINEKTKQNQVKLERDIEKDFVKTNVIGDGNCYYRAISYSIYGNENHWHDVKQKVLKKYDEAFDKLDNSQIEGDLIATQLYFSQPQKSNLKDYKIPLKELISENGNWGGTNVIVNATGLWIYEEFKKKHLIILAQFKDRFGNIIRDGFSAISTNGEDKNSDIYKINANKYFYILDGKGHYWSYRQKGLKETKPTEQQRIRTQPKSTSKSTRPSSSQNTTSRRASNSKKYYDARAQKTTSTVVDLTNNEEGFFEKCTITQRGSEGDSEICAFRTARNYTMLFIKNKNVTLDDVYYNEVTKQFKGKYNGKDTMFIIDRNDDYKIKPINK